MCKSVFYMLMSLDPSEFTETGLKTFVRAAEKVWDSDNYIKNEIVYVILFIYLFFDKFIIIWIYFFKIILNIDTLWDQERKLY